LTDVAIRLNEATLDLFVCQMSPTSNFNHRIQHRYSPWDEQDIGIEVDEEAVLRTAYELYRV
jgi:hypothetical protein